MSSMAILFSICDFFGHQVVHTRCQLSKKIRFWTWTCHLSIIIETNLFCLAAKCMQLFFFFMSSATYSTQRIILQIFCSKFLKIPLVSHNLQGILLVKILLFFQQPKFAKALKNHKNHI